VQTIEESIRLFNESWSIYQKIIHNNYMFHREIGDAVRSFAAEYFGERPISLMDLGCGDSSQTLSAFACCKVQFYQGCDVSTVALELAEQNLNAAGIPHTLDNTDMLEAAAAAEHRFDVIFSSFAMHHLGLQQKEALLKNVSKALKPDGVLILIDLALAADEDRQTYLDNYLGYAETYWPEMTAGENIAVRNHATGHDFPEKLNTYSHLAQKAGFARVRHLCQHTWHHVLVLENVSD
jgi:2-polyprenyl-3-methyl-5-hydroxy-6-metoxy-1,4-benzoquinol methylase